MRSMKSFNLMAMMAVMFAGVSNAFSGKGKVGKTSLYTPPTKSSSRVQPRTYESRMPLEAGNGRNRFSFDTKFGQATIWADNANSAQKHLRKMLGERFGFRTSFAKY
jgi:hypothetical protein